MLLKDGTEVADEVETMDEYMHTGPDGLTTQGASACVQRLWHCGSPPWQVQGAGSRAGIFFLRWHVACFGCAAATTPGRGRLLFGYLRFEFQKN